MKVSYEIPVSVYRKLKHYIIQCDFVIFKRSNILIQYNRNHDRKAYSVIYVIRLTLNLGKRALPFKYDKETDYTYTCMLPYEA